MRGVLFLIVCLIFFQHTISASEDWKISVGGVKRDIIVTAPSGLNKPALVIVMHGMNGWHKGHQESTKFDQIAEREKFVVVYPNGIDGAWDISGDRDIKFIEAIIDTMVKRYDVDRSRVYATGWSMGGMMSYHLACNIPEKIAAIGPTSGYPLWGAPKCNNSRPVPIIHIHGTADDVVGYSGLHSFLKNKITEYGCPSEPEVTRPYPSSKTGSKTYMERWKLCESNGATSEIVVITIDGMGHWYATDYNGSNVHESEEIWAFFKNYSVGGFSGHRLSLNITGEGSVTRNPNNPGYEEGTEVTITAVSSQGWKFENWKIEGVNKKENPLKIVMDSDKKIDAVFSRSPDDKGNYVLNGDFRSGTSNWTLNVWGGEASGKVINGEYNVDIKSIGTANHDIQLVQSGLFLENGKKYKVTFDAYAASNRNLEVNVEMANDPWTSYLPELQQVELTTEKKSYSFTFTMTHPTDVNGRIGFNAGSSTEAVNIDNVEVLLYDPSAVFYKGKTLPVSFVNVKIRNSAISVRFIAPANQAYLRLYDLRGNLLRTVIIKTNTGKIHYSNHDFSDLSNGYYIVKISSMESTLFTSKIVITR
jgi:poly(3-hydroxybutyrate) depolymerase